MVDVWRYVLATLITGVVLCVLGSTTPISAAQPAQLILHMLDYVAVDYPACVQDGMVLDQAEYDEQLDFAQQVRTMLEQLPTSPEHAALLQQAEQLHALLQGKAPGLDVAALTQQLRWHIIRTYHVAIAPHRAPDLTSAARLFQTHCAGCHGTQGRGDGPAGQRLDPLPSDFHASSRMEQRSVYGLYNTITLGVQGTAMVGFQALHEDERWALAFYVSNFVSSSTRRERGTLLWQSGAGRAWFPDLARLTTATVADIRAQHGDDGVAVLTFLRSRPDLVGIASEAPLAHSARLLHESLAAYRQGQLHTAQQLAISAYVDGFELAEARLDTVARQLRSTVEADMLQYRTLLKSGAPLARVEAQATRLQELLSNAQGMLEATQLSATTSFLSAFVILLREGLEAMVVLAAILAFLMKTGRRDALPYVHVGWVTALVCGSLTWIMASYLITISGATREVTEGVTALAAVVILLYVGFWMHSKAYADRWRAFLTQQLQTTLAAPTLWALAFVSFLAVYREAFETVLFYQALWLQAGTSSGLILGGGLSAAVVLVGLGWLIFKGSVRLPLSQFFGLTSALLALLAVVFAGQGIAALQEAGTLPVDPVPFPSLPALGLYPSLQGLMLQAILLGVIASVFLYTYYTAKATR